MAPAADHETAPLLADRRDPEDALTSSVDTICAADFDPDGDSENPLEWTTPYKWFIVFLLAMSAFTVYVVFAFGLTPIC